MKTPETFLRGKKYCARTKKHVKITANMGALLHYLLTSISYSDGKFILVIDDKTGELLKDFNFLDIVDTYERLGLNRGVFGDYLVNKSRSYVTKKVIKLYHQKKMKVIKNE